MAIARPRLRARLPKQSQADVIVEAIGPTTTWMASDCGDRHSDCFVRAGDGDGQATVSVVTRMMPAGELRKIAARATADATSRSRESDMGNSIITTPAA